MKRDPSIDTLRGLAALLLVAFHSIELRAMQAPEQSGYAYFAYSFELVRMPLFTVLSGYVYAMRPLRSRSVAGIGDFLRGKARRLLIPLVTAITIWLAIKRSTGMLPEAAAGPLELLGYYLHSYEVFWFLQGLFWVFLAVVVLERFGLLERPSTFLGTLAASAVGALVLSGPTFLSLWSVPYLAPFFLLGLGYRRFEEQIADQPWVRAVVAAALGCLALQQLNWWLDFGISTERFTMMSIATGLTCTFALLRYRSSQPMLSRLGLRSYAIYLYHLVGIAMASRVADSFGHAGHEHLVFASKLMLGLTLPIALEQVVARFAPTRVLVLGLRPRARVRPVPPV